MEKLRHHGAAQQQQANNDPTRTQQGGGPAAGQAGQASANQGFQQSAQQAPQQTQEQRSLQNVDVDAVLQQMAAKKGGGGNYRTSIVDLLKLLDLDSSLEARKELATELGVNAGATGSAEQNIALQKAVMRKLAENGGKVPDELRH
jgi:hypothetical protein